MVTSIELTAGSLFPLPRRKETASRREFCVAVFLSENSRFDEQCNMASPLWNVGLKHRIAGRPREEKLSALLTEGALYHLSSNL